MQFDDSKTDGAASPVAVQDLLQTLGVHMTVDQAAALLELLDEAGSAEEARELLKNMV